MLVLIAGNLSAQGLTRHGEITNSSTVFIDKNGKIGSTPALNQSGAVAAAAVSIGTQTWTARNLEVTTYRNGDPIRYAGNIDDWTDANTDKEGAWCYYADAEGNNANYGKLYNWYAVNDGRGLAPEGWHIPSDVEWTKLRDFLGGESVAGGKLKEAGISHWKPTNDGATNESGFTALPGGYRFDDGAFDYIGSTGFWWSSSEYLTSYAWGRYLSFHSSILSGNSYGKGYGFSVRCVKELIVLTSIAAITGTPNVGSELTAGALSPSGATATYQWTICSTVDGTYTNISSATTNKYTPVEADLGKFIKVVATGSAGSTGTVTSDPTSSVSLSIGYSYGGGKVAYILQSGDPGYDANITKGLIAATEDQSTAVEWITGGSTQITLNGNTLRAIGAGQANTNFMIAQAGYTGGAAKVCDDYSNGEFSDWYLPSINELTKLYDNRTAIGGFKEAKYWSSSEYLSEVASSLLFDLPTEVESFKSFTGYVRAVRSFAILPSVTIGSQVWAARNLDVTTYRDGTTITYAANATEWANANTANEGAWCYYNFDANNGNTYGKLYNWYAVRDARGLAPIGWSVAGYDDWATLATYLGDVGVAGDKMKEAGTSHWQPTNTGATNSSGFTALPGGFINVDGAFYGIGSYGYWWGIINTNGQPYDRELHYGAADLKSFIIGPKYGFSVRCFKDDGGI